MKKNTRFIIIVLMLIFGVSGVGSIEATFASEDTSSNDGEVWEKYRTIPEAKFPADQSVTQPMPYDGGRRDDGADFRLQAAPSLQADCPISRYVSTAGSDVTGTGDNDCLAAASPCKTIQHAIDVSNGAEACPEVIHVAAGTYAEHINMNAWESLDGGWNSDFTQQWDFENSGLSPGPTFAAIIDGAANGTCITQNGLAGANISGFTIQNGKGLAGGIYLDQSHPTISYCTIKENHGESGSGANRSAGGLYNHYANPTVESCAFKSNDCQGSRDYTHASAVLNEYSKAQFANSSFSQTHFSNSFDFKGSGMVNVNSSPMITKCMFEDNSCGMAARCPLVNYDSTVSVKDSLFVGNRCGEGGPGAIENVNSSVTITNTRFLNNVSIQTGSAPTVGNYSSTCAITNSIFAGNVSRQTEWGTILGNSDSDFTITNSTFSENRFVQNYNSGAVIQSIEDSHGTMKNSIIWGSRGDENTGAVTAVDVDESSTFDVAYSDIEQDGFAGSNGNIQQDPKTVKSGWQDNGTPDNIEDDAWAGGDYHLQSDSPCIDSGTQDGVTLEDTDHEGDLRILDGDSDFVAQVDMGADEFKPIEDDLDIVSLSIIGPSAVTEDGYISYSATASWDDGTDSTVTPTWSVDAGSVSIDTSGVMRTPAVESEQTVMITAKYSHNGVIKTATQAVRIANSSVTLTLKDGSSIKFTASAGNLNPSEADIEYPEQMDFIYPALALNVDGISPGSLIDITLEFPNAIPEGGALFKMINGEWQQFENYSQFNQERTTIDFQLSDGGYGDDDNSANGIIHDPVGIAIDTSVTPADSDGGSGGGGGGGGGCFILTAED